MNYAQNYTPEFLLLSAIFGADTLSQRSSDKSAAAIIDRAFNPELPPPDKEIPSLALSASPDIFEDMGKETPGNEAYDERKSAEYFKRAKLKCGD